MHYALEHLAVSFHSFTIIALTLNRVRPIWKTDLWQRWQPVTVPRMAHSNAKIAYNGYALDFILLFVA